MAGRNIEYLKSSYTVIQKHDYWFIVLICETNINIYIAFRPTLLENIKRLTGMQFRKYSMIKCKDNEGDTARERVGKQG